MTVEAHLESHPPDEAARLWILRPVVLFGLTMTAVTVGLLAVIVVTLHTVRLEQAEARTLNYASSLAGHAERAFNEVDITLKQLAFRFRDRVARGETIGPRLHPVLKFHENDLPQVRDVFVVSAEGRILADSYELQPPPLDLSDRDYVRAHLGREKPDFFVGKPAISRLRGTYFFATSRRIEAHDGTLLGIIVGIVNPQYFRDFYDTLASREPAGFALVARDGTVLASNSTLLPGTDDALGHTLSGLPFEAALELRPVTVQTEDGSGTPILASIARVAGLPIGNVVVLARADALVDWYRTATALGGVCLLVIIACGVFLGFDARQTRRLAESRRQLDRLAATDPLTGLANRNRFTERLDLSLAVARRAGTLVAVLMLDLDRFKAVNDTYGHTVGDALLKVTGERLVATLRRTDTVARLGGDEFAIIATDLRDAAAAATVAQKLIDAVGRPMEVHGISVTPATSIGIAVYPGDSEDREELLNRADTALYQAKDAGRQTYRLYDRALDARARRIRAIEDGLREAAGLEELSLAYQPKVASDTGCVVGVEALLRWRHDGRWISPAEFIPVAETSGQILKLGDWVLQEACRQHRLWREAGITVPVAVNVSPRQFRQEDFAERVAELVEREGVAPDQLELEITEGMLIDSAGNAPRQLERLSRSGVVISIDDFGTGYSSLAYLRRLPIAKLKIDKSIIAQMADGSDSDAIIGAIVLIGKSLNLTVVAEGVETEGQMRTLIEMGCDQMQGFHLAHPLAPADLADLLARGPALPLVAAATPPRHRATV